MSGGSRILCALAALLASSSGAGNAGTGDERRVRFTVSAVEEAGGRRTVVAETLIEGPPGIDFDLDLHAQRFSLEGRFTTDLFAAAELEVGAALEARRLRGTSDRGLPLYEIDQQRHTLRVGFDQAIALSPFGAGAGGRSLTIEIAPAWVDGGAGEAIDIRVTRPAPAGMIDVAARLVPHRFRCQARLLERGREIGRGEAACRMDRPSEIALADLRVAITVDRSARDQAGDEVAIHFDVDRRGAGPIARRWAGAGGLGDELRYDVGGGRALILSVAAAR
jgi:hypothetical protein